jgi:hypothetical protein
MTTTAKNRQARDCDGSPLQVGDCVSPANYPGANSEAPVYTITQICTDDSTVKLRRSDGSHLWETASCLLYMPEATRRAHLATAFRGEPGCQTGSGPLFAPARLVELYGQGTRVIAVGSIESWQLSDPKDGGPVTLSHNVLLEQESDPAAPILQPFVERLPLFKPGMQLILRGVNSRGRHIALAGEVTAYYRLHCFAPFAMFTLTSTLPTASPDPEFYF